MGGRNLSFGPVDEKRTNCAMPAEDGGSAITKRKLLFFKRRANLVDTSDRVDEPIRITRVG